MAGSSKLIASKEFNIYTTTLEQFADLYVAEANLKDPEDWANDCLLYTSDAADEP